jgi:hypothetical protein
MANTLRIKRRASGAAGSPALLANAELAFNEVDNVLYYGKGTGGAGGTATTVEAIAGNGAFLALTGSQTVSGNKIFLGSTTLGTATATTVSNSDNSTNLATTAFVKNQGYLTANQNITISGDATGSGSTAIVLTLANTGISAGTYTKFTVNSKGLATAGTTLADTDIPSLTAAKITNFDTQVRTNRLDQMAVPTASVSLNNQKITGLAEPTAATDAATKNYVDSARSGLDVKQSVKAATTANITLSGTQTIDDIAVVADDRVLVKNQSTASQNGIYLVQAGSWVRANDFDSDAEVTPGAFTFVEEGTVNADSGWVLTTNATISIGSTSLTFVQFSGAGQIEAGAGLTKTGNTFDVGAGTGIIVGVDSIGLTGQALALHNLADNGIFVRTGSGTVSARSVAVTGNGITVTNGNGVSGDPTLALNASIAAFSGVTLAADKLPYFSSSSAVSTTDFSAFGRSLIDDADASAARTTLGLGTMATQASSNVSITGGTIDSITIDGGTF